MTFEFRAPVWLYDGAAAWHFVTLPRELGEHIAELTDGLRRGFGSLRVSVEVSGVRWQTSIFPDSSSGSFLLPVKKDVRTRASIEVGDEIAVTMTLRDL